MKSLKQAVQALENAQYLQAGQQLLVNGQRFSDQIAQHWWHTRLAGAGKQCDLNEKQPGAHFEQRLQFVQESSFRAQLAALRRQSTHQQCPAVIRYAQLTPDTATQLVCQYVCNASNALEHYYKIQRERKIWWMRCSANPSRYSLEPYTLPEMPGSAHCQSITINSQLSFCQTAVEHITLVPLQKMQLPTNEEEYLLRDERSGRQLLPTIIRAVIDLPLATYALLLDGCDHNRNDTLLLHRKLVPFQCALATTSQDEELQELCNHLRDVMLEAKLRCFDAWPMAVLQDQLHYADCLGIPYVLMVDQSTLHSGLLKLRSRDTTLAEKIHISDIPTYLLNIFTH